jgi:hypothetical protein
MSIKRITNPLEFNQLIDDLHSLFLQEDLNEGHQFLKHSPEMIKTCFSHSQILAWEMFVWANKNGDSFDAAIMFANDKNPKFNTRIFSEFLWLSKNPKVGYKLFKTAVDFAKQKDFGLLAMSTVVKHPKHEKIKSFYEKMGLLKDSETYICKL